MIFKDEAEKQAAISYLPTLKDHPGWKLIERGLDENLVYFRQKLASNQDFRSLEEVYYLQKRISDIEQFKQLPDTLLAAASDALPEPEEDADPYPTLASS